VDADRDEINLAKILLTNVILKVLRKKQDNCYKNLARFERENLYLCARNCNIKLKALYGSSFSLQNKSRLLALIIYKDDILAPEILSPDRFYSIEDAVLIWWGCTTNYKNADRFLTSIKSNFK